MARGFLLTREMSESIARHATEFLPAVGIALQQADNPEIGETLQIWMLPATAISERNPLSSAFFAGRLHHQIFRRNKPIGFAYSQFVGPSPNDWRITGAFESWIAAEIDEAIRVADERYSDASGEARLLNIPAYHLQVLWLVGTPDGDLLIPAAVPKEHRRRLSIRSHDPDEFFEILSHMRQITGFTPSP